MSPFRKPHLLLPLKSLRCTGHAPPSCVRAKPDSLISRWQLNQTLSSPSRSPSQIQPTVPAHEDDLAARINVMKAIFNNTLQDLGLFENPDTGFAHEILTADYLLNKILHFDNTALRGCHISRPLIIREIAEGLRGDAQLVKVPMGGGAHRFRKLDMVFFDHRPGGDGKLTIVEARSTRFADHQMRPNVLLARRLGCKVMYSVDRPRQEEVLQAAYNRIPETQGLPPLEIIVPLGEHGRFVDRWREDARRGGRMSFARTYTEEDRLRFDRFDRFERPELYEAVNTEEGTRYKYRGEE